MMRIPRPAKRHFFTPLRYPGGKTFLYEFFDQVLKKNALRDVCYVEPYAGGAGAALSLLLLEKVDSIVINDYDRAIYAFWKSILEDVDRFVERIRQAPVTIDEWRKQSHIFKSDNSDTFDLGFASFFLNRTNHSGILNGGPIGGLEQKGRWSIDARYNQLNLIEKIRLISLYKDRITVLNQDGLTIIREYSRSPNVFSYIDPPYYVRGNSLYMNFYKHADHVNLASLLNSLSSSRWILSYDNVEPIRQLYKMRKTQFEFSLHYQARESRQGSELIVLSDSLQLPEPMA